MTDKSIFVDKRQMFPTHEVLYLFNCFMAAFKIAGIQLSNPPSLDKYRKGITAEKPLLPTTSKHSPYKLVFHSLHIYPRLYGFYFYR